MKTFANLFFVLFLANLAACNQADVEMPTKHKIDISSTFEDKVYEFGESCQVDLSITEEYAEEDYFYLHITKVQGEADIYTDIGPLELDNKGQIYHTVHNPVLSIKDLVIFVTPTASSTSNQIVKFVFTVTSSDGKAVSTCAVEISAKNSAPIIVSAKHSYEPIAVSANLAIELDIMKEGFTGTYDLSFKQVAGRGFCEFNGRLDPNNSIKIASTQSPLVLQYQPILVGAHEIEITISESGLYKSTVSVKCDVFKDDVSPEKDGFYIYANNYAGSAYLTLKDWNSFNGSIKAEGLVIIDKYYDLRIVLPLHACQPAIFCNDQDDLTLIPGIDFTNKGNGKDNTEKIYKAYKSGIISTAPIVEACYNYDPASPGRWYLPSHDELFKISQRWWLETERMMRAIGGTISFDASFQSYVSSSIYSSKSIYIFNCYSNKLHTVSVGSGDHKKFGFFPIRNLK